MTSVISQSVLHNFWLNFYIPFDNSYRQYCSDNDSSVTTKMNRSNEISVATP